MKISNERPFYTPKEILELLQAAKSLGVKTITVPGFEASWDVQSSFPVPTPEKPRQDERKQAPRSLGHCKKYECGAELIEGTWGPYCKPCALRRKEERWQNRRNW